MDAVEPENSNFTSTQREDALRVMLIEAGVENDHVTDFIESGMVAGALWHLWHPKDTPLIRKLLKDTDKKQYRAGSGNDPIHDQDTYITKDLR